MFCTGSGNLVLALCLAVQTATTPCIPCPCGGREGEPRAPERVFGPGGNAMDQGGVSCTRCRSAAELQQVSRHCPRDRQSHPHAATVHESFLLDDNSPRFGVLARCGRFLPSPDVDEFRVLLE